MACKNGVLQLKKQKIGIIPGFCGTSLRWLCLECKKTSEGREEEG